MTTIPSSSFSSRISAVFGPLAGLDLAAGKLPQAGHRLAGGPLCDQHAAVGIDQGAGGDQDEFTLSVLASRDQATPVKDRSTRLSRWQANRDGNTRLRPVVAVDRDIFLGEIAGQHAVAALAEAERDLQR